LCHIPSEMPQDAARSRPQGKAAKAQGKGKVKGAFTAKGKGSTKGKGKGKEEGRLTSISKMLATMLRHTAVQDVGADGYMAVQDVLDCPKMKRFRTTIFDLRTVTRDSDKARFELSVTAGRGERIRAVQGHSIPHVLDQNILEEITEERPEQVPSMCTHATKMCNVTSILTHGLKVGGVKGPKIRNHIHMTALPAMPLTKPRQDAHVHVDIVAAMRAGIKFWRSQNGVILTSGWQGTLPSKYIMKVTNVNTGHSLWWPSARQDLWSTLFST
jgi:2'-phosphotransferase